MASIRVQLTVSTSRIIPPIPGTPNMIRSQRLTPSTHSRTNITRFCECPSGSISIFSTKVADQNSVLVVDDIKSDLYQRLKGINRGIFGIPSAKKSEIEDLVKLLESQNSTPDFTLNSDKVAGMWKLVYSTITILGSKRTKLGLRDFISLGDFLQIIDVAKSKAINVINFNVRGLDLFNGQLIIEATFKIASKTRVEISYDKSTITPDQLMNMFRKNYDLLLEIFNPEGWLEITYPI